MHSGWRKVLVWDLPIRLFHWLTVALLVVLYVTERLNWIGWHVRAGQILLGLVIFRLIWGMVGSETARFTHFIASPKKAVQHCKRMVRREPDTGIGHNAAGGWMVLLIIALLLIQCLTGVIINNDIANEGGWTEMIPASVADAISSSHAWLWDVLLAAIAVHIAAIATYAIAKRHNLLIPMLTGRKPLPPAMPAPRIAKLWLAAVALAIGAAASIAITEFL